MSSQGPDARGAEHFVDAASGIVDWYALEQDAFEGHPEVQRAISESVADTAQPPLKGEWIFALLLLFVELGPVLAYAVAHISGAAQVGRTAALLLVAAIGAAFIAQQVALWRRMAHDVREVGGRRVLLAWANAVFSLGTLLWVFTAGRESDLWWLAAVVTALTTATAITTAIRMRHLGKQESLDGLENALVLATPVGRSRAAVASLSDEQRAAIRGRIDGLVQELLRMGVVDADVARDAMRQPLGSLGRWELAMRMHTQTKKGTT